jgi:RNA polymerase subunit RPABC4/transcription elongation factor Spt4
MRAVIALKVCRDCGEEYRPEIERCSDCGGELVARMADDAAPEASDAPLDHGGPERPLDAPEALDPAELRPVHVADRAEELDAPARALAAAGIRFAARGSMYQFALLVRESDLARAADVLRARFAPADAVEDSAEGPAACPACGHALAEPAEECPGCGLSLAGPAAHPCTRCGKPVPVDARECAACGAAFE